MEGEVFFPKYKKKKMREAKERRAEQREGDGGGIESRNVINEINTAN